MNRKSIDESDIRQLALDLGLPLERVLRQFVLQEFARLISSSKYNSRLLIVNPAALNLEEESAIRTGNKTLRYHYILNPSEKFDRASFTYVLKDAVKYVDETPVEYTWQTELDGERLRVDLQGAVGDLTVPFCVYVSVEQEMLRPESISLTDLIEKDMRIDLGIYPASSRIASDMLIIIRDLDFVADMGPYYSLYQTLTSMEFDARHMQRSWFDMMEKHGVPVSDERFAMILEYKGSAQMKKRWISYLKKKKKEITDWEMVIDLIKKATEPIWNAQTKGEVFIGDWMPELGKYL